MDSYGDWVSRDCGQNFAILYFWCDGDGDITASGGSRALFWVPVRRFLTEWGELGKEREKKKER